MTPTGRIPKDASGQCAVPLPDLTLLLPYSVLSAHDYHPPKKIWVGQDDGNDCVLYQKNDGKPQASSAMEANLY